MQDKNRTIKYDQELMMEAYHFRGIQQKFPNHFHDYYVVGYIEKGNRYVSCKNKDYTVNAGDLLLLNPGDNHICEQIDEELLDFRGLNIQPETMQRTMLELYGRPFLPHFHTTVVHQSELVVPLRELHQMMMEGNPDFGKEEAFLLLLEQLTSCYAEMEPEPPAKPFHTGIEAVCAYLDEHYASPTSLEELARLAGMNKYSLLRAFTRSKGITPYRYLETVRVSRAKRLLEQGMEPADVALQTGFSDQSHFSNYFKEFIGLTPGQYRDIFLKSPYESED